MTLCFCKHRVRLTFFSVLFIALLLPVTAMAELDKDYIREHYPEVYRQIYEEGKSSVSAPASQSGESSKAVDNAKPAAQEAADAPKVNGPGDNWWEHLSLKYKPLPENLLFHAEALFTPVYKWGNTTGYQIDGQGAVVLRKNRLTNSLNYQIAQKLTKDASGSQSTDDYQTFQESLQYDLTEKFYTQGGYIWERDRVNMIKHRHIEYAGLGYYLFDTPLHKLEFFLSGGYQTEKYYSMIQDFLNISQKSLPVVYFYESYKINITSYLFYNEIFRIIQDVSTTPVFVMNEDGNYIEDHRVHRYRWTMINALGYTIDKHLAIIASHKMDYDSSPWPTVISTDNVFKVSLRVSF
ncbi:MAG: DUF481 domain-containing protein [Nitrospirae bacterium]|nr:DUF481 domain-containing protein [Nitrospirota bacterium]